MGRHAKQESGVLFFDNNNKIYYYYYYHYYYYYYCKGVRILRKNEYGKRWSKKKKKWRWGATRGLPRRSPILVLLSPKHA